MRAASLTSVMLPKPSKVAKVEHHAAMPFDDLPAFMSELRAATGLKSIALLAASSCVTSRCHDRQGARCCSRVL
jgi:hypothetical protein